MTLLQSGLDPATAAHDDVQQPGEPWTRVIRAGQVLRIVDLEGTQAVDTLCYDAYDSENRYSAADTIRAQRNLFLSTGSRLDEHRRRRARHGRRRHVRAARHGRRRVQRGVEHVPVRTSHPVHAQLP